MRIKRILKKSLSGLAAALLLPASIRPAAASTAYGSINNFDCVNDTGTECHGFEIEIEDIHSKDITYTYDWNHYGTPQISEDNSNPAHPKVIVRYASARKADGTWAAYTAIPSGPIAATDGHQFTNPNVNFGGEHFGVGFIGNPTNITYHWLMDDGSGTLVRGPAVQIATPAFNYVPPVAGMPAQVQAVIQAPPAPPVLEFGPATWVKEIRTTTHNNREVKLRDLVSDDPDDDEDKNWRNGEPDEVEVEWQILQTEFNKAGGGENGELAAAPDELPEGDEVVTRRYEFYEYLGPLDEETGEAKATKVGPDGIHGVGIKTINGAEVDLSQVMIVGNYLGAQMSAFDPAAPVGLIEHVQDGWVAEPYPTRRVVVAGALPFVATNWGTLPEGMSFNRVSGELSGTPIETGVFTFTVEAKAGNEPAVRRTFTLTISENVEALPPRYIVDTLAYPLSGGSTSGDGAYENETEVTVTAAAAAGYVFVNWTDNGKPVSSSATYTFTPIVNRSLVANFAPEPPRLAYFAPQPGVLAIRWPTNQGGFRLEETLDLLTGNWSPVAGAPTIQGTNNAVLIFPQLGGRFFRLAKP